MSKWLTPQVTVESIKGHRMDCNGNLIPDPRCDVSFKTMSMNCGHEKGCSVKECSNRGKHHFGCNTVCLGPTKDATDIYRFPIAPELNKKEFTIPYGTFVIGGPTSGKTNNYVIPEIMSALTAGANVFTTIENDEKAIDRIINHAKECGYDIYVMDDNKNILKWFPCIGEPEVIKDFVNDVMRYKKSKEQEEIGTNICSLVLEKVLEYWLWDMKANMEYGRTVDDFIKFLSAISIDKLKEITKNSFNEKTLTAVTSILIDKLKMFNVACTDCTIDLRALKNKHLILFKMSHEDTGFFVGLVLKHYLRVTRNLRYWEPFLRHWEPFASTAVVIDDLSIVDITDQDMLNYLDGKNDATENAQFLFTIHSEFQLKRLYGETTEEIFKNGNIIKIGANEEAPA